jgi:hypothetical protein
MIGDDQPEHGATADRTDQQSCHRHYHWQRSIQFSALSGKNIEGLAAFSVLNLME